jgi:hypothetical protein
MIHCCSFQHLNLYFAKRAMPQQSYQELNRTEHFVWHLTLHDSVLQQRLSFPHHLLFGAINNQHAGISNLFLFRGHIRIIQAQCQIRSAATRQGATHRTDQSSRKKEKTLLMLPSSGRFLLSLNRLQKLPLIPVAPQQIAKKMHRSVWSSSTLHDSVVSTLYFRLQQTQSPRVALY